MSDTARDTAPGATKMHAMTLRLPQDLADQLNLAAMVDERPVVEVVRSAISQYLLRRMREPDFQAGLRKKIQTAKDMLAGDQDGQ